MKKTLIWQSLVTAVCEVSYVGLVVLVMNNAERLFGDKPEILKGIAFLTMFVISAAVSAALIFGRPVLLYLEGKKKDSITFFSLMIGWLVLIFLLLLTILVV
ncbi:MAG: hypothetical protein ACD_8C00124G0005 [uncultured bacterium]|nr:MAG: hypothetical protein ACD_8C00124G0005 [uncultured bacterium]